MAIRPLDPPNTIVQYRRTSGLPAFGAGDFTYLRWIRLDRVVTPAAFKSIATFSNAVTEFDTNYVWIGLDSDGQTLALDVWNDPTDHYVTGPVLTVGMWYHVAYVKAGATHSLYLSSLDGTDDLTLAAQIVSADGDVTLASIWTDVDASMEQESVKLYTRALNATEIRAERDAPTLIDATNIYNFATFYDPDAFTDSSGNGRDWTLFSGTLHQAAGPFFNESIAYSKLYLINALTALFSPTTVRGSWDITTEFIAGLTLSGYKGGGNLPGISSGTETAAGTVKVGLDRWVSEPLDAQTFGGTIDLVIGARTFAADSDCSWALHVFVTVGETDAVRGTLLDTYTDPLSNEIPSAGPQGWSLDAPQALSAVTCQRGDRLVIELGFISRNALTAGRGVESNWGAVVTGGFVGRPDLTPGSTNVTTEAGHFLFSQPVLFYEPAPAVGDVLVGNKHVYLYDATGALKRRVFLPGEEPAGSVVAANGHIFFAAERNIPIGGASNGPALVEFDHNLNLLTHHTGGAGTNTHSLAQDVNGFIYAGHGGGGGTPCGETVGTGLAAERPINKYAPDGAFVQAYAAAPDLGGTPAIELAADGATMFYTSLGRKIKRYDVVSDVQLADFATLPPAVGAEKARGIALLPDGGVLVADFVDIKRYDAGGALIQIYDNATTDWGTVCVDRDQIHFWAATTANPGIAPAQITKFRLSDGAVILSVANGNIFDSSPGSLCSGGIQMHGGFRPPTAVPLPPVPPPEPVPAPQPPCPCPPEDLPPEDDEDDEEIDQVIVLGAVDTPPQLPASSPCVGGGEVVAGVNPPVGVDLCGAQVPVAYVDLTPPGGTLKRYSKVPINVTTADDPRVERFGTITRALVNRSGDLRGSTLTSVLVDTDRALRALEATDSLVNALLELYVSTEVAIRARAVTPLDANLPRRVFSGSVTSAKPLKGLQMQLQASGYLQSLMDLQPPPEYPQRRFTLGTFPNMGNDPTDPISPGNPGMLGKPIPIGYGALTDDHYPVPQGVVPAIFTGQRSIPALNKSLDEYVLFSHAPTAFHSLFVPTGPGLSLGTDYPARMRIALPESGEFYWPGTGGWSDAFGSQNYRDINGERLTVFYAEGPRSVLARTGQVPILVNICGIEETGDGTGRMIDSLARQILHFLINFVTQNYTIGDWLPHLTVNADAPYARIRSTSFEACKTRSEARVAGGHIGAWLLGQDGQTMILNALTRRFHLHGIDLGENKDGQLIGSMVTPAAPVVRDILDVTDVLKQSFESDRRRDEIKNSMGGFYARRYARPLNFGTPQPPEQLPPFPGQQDWVSQLTPVTHAGSIGKYGTRPMVLELDMTREQATAEDLRDLQLELRGTGPIVNSFEENLCGTNEDLGDNVELTHFEGTSDVGYVDRIMRCEKHTLDVDNESVRTEHLDLEGFPP
jgi:hypothetical protein